ncbi:hypothetical protein EIN_244140 [Entamoeba invadens IP1]|uniref:Uncharacterized protein n=1 Tax=Entamoeba invadens IP1 TaxID=370355 RepID=A0A0A1TUW2_ENTIV|nr:hypothetical protein EIN_244140 [Entamoeba invadens IP1]ELP83953.1 hypothetical protein EIN_244140 [Entamoeba invadens IP1]|eukprot:XP_004183299.1 hypothetical protein EIN_244140 [Entamoeba invadens IP1]
MFVLLFLVTLSSAKYLVEDNSITKLGKIYEISNFNYIKYTQEGMYIYKYVSSDCKEWIPSTASLLSSYGVPQYSLPDYVAVSYTYPSTKDCTTTNEDSNPIERLYLAICTRGTDDSSQYAIENNNLVEKKFTSNDCTGTAKDTKVKYELDKCNTELTYSYKITSGAFEIFALLAIALAFLF